MYVYNYIYIYLYIPDIFKLGSRGAQDLVQQVGTVTLSSLERPVFAQLLSMGRYSNYCSLGFAKSSQHGSLKCCSGILVAYNSYMLGAYQPPTIDVLFFVEHLMFQGCFLWLYPMTSHLILWKILMNSTDFQRYSMGIF